MNNDRLNRSLSLRCELRCIDRIDPTGVRSSPKLRLDACANIHGACYHQYSDLGDFANGGDLIPIDVKLSEELRVFLERLDGQRY